MSATLRERALKGGALMVLRQGFGMVLSLASVLIVTRIIGPRQYGLFAASVAIVIFLDNLGAWGLDVYLLRKHTDPDREEYAQALTLLLTVAAVFSTALYFFRQGIASFSHLPEAAPVLGLLGTSLLFSLGSIPFVVKLDRELNFKRVAINEVVSQASNVAVSLSLALKGEGAFAPAAGYLTQKFVLLGLSMLSVPTRVGLHWDWTLAKRMLGYGFSYSSASWIWQLRSLVNPLIVARLAGAEAVAFIAIAIRMTETLSFARAATWRIAMAALAKLKGDPARLRRSISEGMRLQAIAVGVPLALFAICAAAVIPHVFGTRWGSALSVLPFIMMSYLTNAMFNLHSSVLYSLGHNIEVARFHILHLWLFIGGAVIFVPTAGIVGYGWAELLALLSYFAIDSSVARYVGRPDYRKAALWYATTVGVFASSWLGAPWSYAGVLLLPLPFLFSDQRAHLSSYAELVLRRSANAA